jgi:hypothetical protein
VLHRFPAIPDIDSLHINIITSMKVKGFAKHEVLDHFVKALVVF